MSKAIEELEKRLALLRAIENKKATVFLRIAGVDYGLVERKKLASGRLVSQNRKTVWIPAIPLIEVEERK